MLKLETITKKFGDKVAVNQLDMIVKPGEIMGLMVKMVPEKRQLFE